MVKPKSVIKTVSDPILNPKRRPPRKPKRKRHLHTFSLDSDTINGLHAIVSDKECDNISRAVDEAVSFYAQNKAGVVLNMPTFVTACLAEGISPVKMLEKLAAAWIASKST